MSSQPESMAEAGRAGSTPPHCGLPEEIVIWEILVRLPPKPLLRCRAVCRSWRRATSTRDFLLAHHARQPSLPLLHGYNWVYGDVESIDIIPFDRRSGPAAADPLSSSHDRLASCDGILISSYCDMFFTICNPATRQYAPLPQLDGFRLLGMYMHRPTGEYRVLLCSGREIAYDAQKCYYYYVFTLGSGKPPRQIGYRNALELAYALKTVQFRGNLHWCIGHTSKTIAFDTTSELFRQMRAPVLPGYAYLFEMDDMMGMSSFVEGEKNIDIWVLQEQDYEGETWTYNCRVELPLAELGMQLEFVHNPWCVEATSWYGEVLLLVKFHNWIIHVDINGKLVARIRHRGIFSTQLRIKQSLVSHTFFPTREGYAVNASPFI